MSWNTNPNKTSSGSSQSNNPQQQTSQQQGNQPEQARKALQRQMNEVGSKIKQEGGKFRLQTERSLGTLKQQLTRQVKEDPEIAKLKELLEKQNNKVLAKHKGKEESLKTVWHYIARPDDEQLHMQGYVMALKKHAKNAKNAQQDVLHKVVRHDPNAQEPQLKNVKPENGDVVEVAIHGSKGKIQSLKPGNKNIDDDAGKELAEQLVVKDGLPVNGVGIKMMVCQLGGEGFHQSANDAQEWLKQQQGVFQFSKALIEQANIHNQGNGQQNNPLHHPDYIQCYAGYMASPSQREFVTDDGYRQADKGGKFQTQNSRISGLTDEQKDVLSGKSSEQDQLNVIQDRSLRASNFRLHLDFSNSQEVIDDQTGKRSLSEPKVNIRKFDETVRQRGLSLHP